jgi:hypothetical protein
MSMLAITSYYNPFRGLLRRQNYNTFRMNLGVQLLTVEWSPTGQFELDARDADILIQVSGGSILWQKERLLNIGLAKAREMGFTEVVFLDCDIIFSTSNWFELVSAELEKHAVIQCFSHVNYLAHIEGSVPELEALRAAPSEYSLPSMAFSMQQGHGLYRSNVPKHPTQIQSFTALSGNPGLAMAIRADLLQHWSYYESNLVGGGDLVAMAALTSNLSILFSQIAFTSKHQDHMLGWAKTLDFKENIVGVTSNHVLHLWHGKLENRGYGSRYAILNECHYDPFSDIQSDRNGALIFAQGSEQLQQRIERFLSSRQDA